MQDISKYQNQLYQIMNQANYFFIQKMSQNISVASEKVAQDKKLDVVLNKEACFYSNPKIDVTTFVIAEMDKNYDKETAKNEKENNEKAVVSQGTKAPAEAVKAPVEPAKKVAETAKTQDIKTEPAKKEVK
jgi:hypothetical protein